MSSVNVQRIGVDLGYGFIKAYSEYEGKEHNAHFRACRGIGRNIDFSRYKGSIAFKANEKGEEKGLHYFVGDLAVIESQPTYNTLGEKIASPMLETLICATLNQIAISDYVQIMLGVPNRFYSEDNEKRIKEQFEGKTYTIEDMIDGTVRDVEIVEISIAREADAGCYYLYTQDPTIAENEIGFCTLGFKTLEMAFYEKGLSFSEMQSDTVHIANINVLNAIIKELKTEHKIVLDVGRVDMDSRYDAMKKIQYEDLYVRVKSAIDAQWENTHHVKVYVGGGTMKRLSEDVEGFDFDMVDDPVLAVAKGLFALADAKFA